MSDPENIKKMVIDELEILSKDNSGFFNDLISRFIGIGKSMINPQEKNLISYYLNRPDLFGINQSIHLASSFVLLTLGESKLNNSLEEIKSCFPQNDPTTIISIIALDFLLNEGIKKHKNTETDEFKALKKIRNRFSEVNWMIGKETANLLAII
jgi:hypothetical protein